MPLRTAVPLAQASSGFGSEGSDGQRLDGQVGSSMAVIRRYVERAACAAFWCGVPVATGCILFWPQGSVLYVGDGPFSLELNAVVSRLPSPLGDFWFFYPATLFALAILVGSVAARRWHPTRRTARPVPLPTFFLPTYIAGIESAARLVHALPLADRAPAA
jgi:uncharacterized membrane protein YhaH (DUF805 family)